MQPRHSFLPPWQYVCNVYSRSPLAISFRRVIEEFPFFSFSSPTSRRRPQGVGGGGGGVLASKAFSLSLASPPWAPRFVAVFHHISSWPDINQSTEIPCSNLLPPPGSPGSFNDATITHPLRHEPMVFTPSAASGPIPLWHDAECQMTRDMDGPPATDASDESGSHGLIGLTLLFDPTNRRWSGPFFFSLSSRRRQGCYCRRRLRLRASWGYEECQHSFY
ncbi:hypothetical protein LZ32DRAFT_302436 [Colletotrichum eremochloae]|nr:hypothetical protein LZ32DRAFT_302436 [Colletotrichum eremochloae]